MNIRRIDILSDRDLTELRRLARSERREQRDMYRAMKINDVIKLFHADLSAWHTRLAQPEIGQEEEAWPSLPSEQLGPYEDSVAVRMLILARTFAHPLMVELDCEPSKTFEDRLRQRQETATCGFIFSA